MDTVQRMRKKTQEKGALQSNEQRKVTPQTVESKTVVVIEPANPQVVYVPSYNPDRRGSRQGPGRELHQGVDPYDGYYFEGALGAGPRGSAGTLDYVATGP